MRQSLATIDKPEFINIVRYNPLISECEIKVLYLGENRNHSYIDKETAMKMANTLPGSPIVGYYKEDKEDFRDHGERVVMDGDSIEFKCMTRPYGFVAPDAKVWFQKFEDTDEFGNVVIREYLMTTGFLWTGQYPECQSIVQGGKPQSMELDEDTLEGKWTKNYKTGVDFFIINDAIFSKLCVLGDDVEPCFEGSSITAPQVSSSFSLDEEFKVTLFSMMQELKEALKGEQRMVEMIDNNQSSFVSEEEVQVEENFTVVEEETVVEDTFAKQEEEEKQEEDKEKKEFSKSEEEEEDKDDSEDKEDEDEEDKKDKFAKEDEKEKDENLEDKEDKSSEDKKEEEEDKEKKYSLLQEEYDTLKTQYSDLESKYNSLLAFKNQIEDEKKDSLINSFYMLSDEDKKEVIQNKSQYSLDEIEAKLSVICVRKKVSFDLEENEKENIQVENPVTTFNLEDQVSAVPAWITAVRNTKNSRNI